MKESTGPISLVQVEVVVDASRAPPVEKKGMSDRVRLASSLMLSNYSADNRISKPRVQPKQAGAARTSETSARGATRGARGGRVRRGRTAGRPKAKTAEELDAEMTDYFVGGSGHAATEANGAAAPNGAAAAATGEEAMDEISVRSFSISPRAPLLTIRQ